MNQDQEESRIWRLFDGDLTAEEFAELEHKLGESPEARARFLDHVDLHVLLGQTLSQSQHATITDYREANVKRWRPRPRTWMTLAAAAVILLTAVIHQIVVTSGPQRIAGPTNPSNSATVPSLASIEASEDAIYQVTHANHGSKTLPGDALAAGSRLTLTRGTTNIRFSSGVLGTIKAPADIEIVSATRIQQHEGHALYNVPASAIGFEVVTHELQIEDLGTEFGVISSPEKPDEIHLLVGKVAVGTQQNPEKKELLSGRVARIASPSGSLKSIPVRADDFNFSLNQAYSYVHISFDSIEGDQFGVEADHKKSSNITAQLVRGDSNRDQSPLIEGMFNQAIRLNGNGEYIQTDWPGIPGSTPRTIALWLRLPDDEPNRKWESIVAWGDTKESGDKFVVTWNYFPELGQYGALRFSSRDGYVVGSTDLRDGKWHHICVVYGGEPDSTTRMPIKLYVDGEIESVTGHRYSDVNTSLGRDSSSWMSIGRFQDADVEHEGTLKGDIDDLHIFSNALTQSQIKKNLARRSK